MQSNKEFGAHALLVTSTGKILLVSKGATYAYDKKNAGKVAMFGGRVENGEDALTGLRRELFEELGLEVAPDRIRKLNVYQKTKEQDGSDVEVHVFVIYGIDPSTIKIHEEDSGATVLDVNEKVIEGATEELLLRPDLTCITRLALEDFLKYLEPQ